MEKFWGQHLLVDCGGCDIESITSYDNIENFLVNLVNSIDMKAYGDPIIKHFATHDPSKGGYTAVQMIETSLIDGHFVDATGEAYISIHSCKDFDSDVVLSVIREYFNPTSIKVNLVRRQA